MLGREPEQKRKRKKWLKWNARKKDRYHKDISGRWESKQEREEDSHVYDDDDAQQKARKKHKIMVMADMIVGKEGTKK